MDKKQDCRRLESRSSSKDEMMKHFIGMDIGSTATKCVAVDEEKKVLAATVIHMGAGTKADRKALEKLYQKMDAERSECVRTVATGYGRLLYKEAYRQVSEITCHAQGIHSIFPDVRTVIDVGGQDLKVIRINENGLIEQFTMNDKCAAGTGRFLEVMCRVMDIGLDELALYDSKSKELCQISNTCTVFAESEVISKLSQGCETADIVAGIHDAVARKICGMSKRIGICPKLAVTGGGGLNGGLVKALERNLGIKIKVPENPQIIGALGAALLAVSG